LSRLYSWISVGRLSIPLNDPSLTSSIAGTLV
jgi:hypothetical protein